MESLLFIDNPFLYNKKNSILSLIFHKFYKHTDIPVSIPIFVFLVCLSSFLTVKKCTYTHSLEDPSPKTLDIWVLILADSGCSKTYATKQVMDMIPKNISIPRIRNVVSEKALCIEMKRVQNGLWIQDEGLKFLLSMEYIGSPLQPVKPLLLELKTSGKYERLNSKPAETIILKNNAYGLLFLGTYQEFDLSKAMLKSCYDGLFRRFQFVDGSDKLGRKMEDYPIYSYPLEECKHLIERVEAVFNQEIFPNSNYEFTKEAIDLYTTAFKTIKKREDKNMLKYGLGEATYRTYLMDCFKYAVLHHIMNLKRGHIVDEHSLQFGLQISVYLLHSNMHLFNGRKTDLFSTSNLELIDSISLQVGIRKEKLNRIISFLQQNPTATIRDTCRSYSITKDILLKIKAYVQQ